MNKNNGTLNLLKPVNAYNFIIGIVSGIILLAYGHWQLVLVGIVLSYAGFWVLRFILGVGFFFISGINYQNSYYKQVYSSIFLLFLKTVIIISWGYLVLSVLIRISLPPSLPFLLFTFFIITAPLNILALKGSNPQGYDTPYEQLLFDFMLAAAIFFGLVIELNMLSLVLIAGALVLAIRIFQIIIDFLENKERTDSE